MKKLAMRAAALLICVCTLGTAAWGVEYLIPVGQVIGLEVCDQRVVIAAMDDSLGQQARKAGIQVGDQILQVDGRNITCCQDVRNALDRSSGTVRLRLSRNGKPVEVQLQPSITTDGPKLGVYLKQGVTGIGTVTWYDPDTGAFGTLGHGVNGGNGQLVEMTSGRVFAANVVSVQPGKCGRPGQLRGAVASERELGELRRNTAQGVFGVSREGWQGQALPVAESGQVHTGKATILSTVSGQGVREYSVEIVRIYPPEKSADKNMVIRITDPGLLEVTGGIVQGMSGSPIIQDGKLVGAVTHVLVNDPTRGYGIFIENMLDAAA